MARIALITGVGKVTGLGYETARVLAARGDRVWLAARTVAQAEAMAATIPGDVVFVGLDLVDQAAIIALAARIATEEAALDVVINNAAAVAPWGEKADSADLDVASAVLDVTLMGTWAMCQAFLPLLRRAAAGRLVNVSSGAGSHGDTAFGLKTANGMGTSYAIAKAALNALTAKLAAEETSRLKINAVCPGFTATFEGAAAMGARPVAEGAASILWAADLPDDGPTGGFFRDGQPLAW